MDKRTRVAYSLQGLGATSIVVAAYMVGVGFAFATAGIALILWGVAMLRGD